MLKQKVGSVRQASVNDNEACNIISRIMFDFEKSLRMGSDYIWIFGRETFLGHTYCKRSVVLASKFIATQTIK